MITTTTTIVVINRLTLHIKIVVRILVNTCKCSINISYPEVARREKGHSECSTKAW